MSIHYRLLVCEQLTSTEFQMIIEQATNEFE